MNSKSIKFSPEVRKRTVQMVLDHRGEYPSMLILAIQDVVADLPVKHDNL